MARRIVLTDDLTNEEGTEENPVLTWHFSYGPSNNQKRYTVDLTTENYGKLEDALKRFVNVATEVEDAPAPPRSVSGPRRTTGRPSADKERLNSIREWANANGYTVGDRGRIKAEIVDAYDAAH
ncbi:Lsr2 family protein [Streptomyces sp. NP160]|uniref:histone-like nucleoid-structuring protein Lsr2 n=1 Tax=Streptomyces sp. NP160 TaxID=2586637 RepID=UPI0015D58A6F|nr:Lsr2 family protein [Streptomyces sp. NP160]